MTSGRPAVLMTRFALPLMFANILQLLFTVADGAIVGRMLGIDAFAAVGATASVHWLVLSAILGISHGFETVFAQRYGAGDKEGFKKVFVAAVYLFVAIGSLLALFGLLTSAPLLAVLGTPDALFDDALLYLRILLGGIPIAFAFNVLAGMLRALGDSVTPFRAMLFAMAVNTGLTIALSAPFGLAGAAAATLVSQGLACVYSLMVLRKTGVIDACGRRFCLISARSLLRLGLPLFFRNGVIEVGGLFVQRFVNYYGVEFVAGIAAAKRMYSMLVVVGSALEASVGIFVAQNFGAGDIKRIKQGVAVGRKLFMLSAGFMTALSILGSRFFIGLLISGDPARLEDILLIGTTQLNVMALGLPVLSLLLLYRSALQGMGNAVIPMLSGFLELAARIAVLAIFAGIWGRWAVYTAVVSGWLAAAVLLVVSYYKVIGKQCRQLKTLGLCPKPRKL